MFCTACGTKALEGSTHCTNCGVALPAATASQTTDRDYSPFIANGRETSASSPGSYVGEPSIASGCLVLFVSIFTMPIKTASLAARELRIIAKEGSLGTDNDFPHLSWYKAVLPVFATVCSVAVFIFGLFSAFAALSAFDGGVPTALGLVILSVFGAIVTDWLIMILGELLTINIAAGRYYSRRNRED
jgi:hypothetical protein